MTDAEPGQFVSVRARIVHIDEESWTVEIAGPRPPFTTMHIQISQEEVVALLNDVPEAARPLEIGDKVRDAQGQEFEVVADPRAVEGQPVEVALWNETLGFHSEYESALERIDP